MASTAAARTRQRRALGLCWGSRWLCGTSVPPELCQSSGCTRGGNVQRPSQTPVITYPRLATTRHHCALTSILLHVMATVSSTHTSLSKPLAPRPPITTTRGGRPATGSIPSSSLPGTPGTAGTAVAAWEHRAHGHGASSPVGSPSSFKGALRSAYGDTGPVNGVSAGHHAAATLAPQLTCSERSTPLRSVRVCRSSNSSPDSSFSPPNTKALPSSDTTAQPAAHSTGAVDASCHACAHTAPGRRRRHRRRHAPVRDDTSVFTSSSSCHSPSAALKNDSPRALSLPLASDVQPPTGTMLHAPQPRVAGWVHQAQQEGKAPQHNATHGAVVDPEAAVSLPYTSAAHARRTSRRTRQPGDRR